MSELFAFPLVDWTVDDIRSLIGWTESVRLEFKRELPVEEGEADHSPSGKFSDTTKNKVFKEVVAFANTSGGYLILGVDETKDKPSTANGFLPISGCGDLAERLSKSAATSIDPPIPGLQVRAIQMEKNGAGVVVFYVPPSRSAPHRCPNREVYVRRDADSVPIKMKEIQDLTLASATRAAKIDARFSQLATQWNLNIEHTLVVAQAPTSPRSSDMDGLLGYRISAVPASELALPRLYGRKSLLADAEATFYIGDTPRRGPAGSVAPPRPILRGVEHRSDVINRRVISLHQDGVVEFETLTNHQGRITIQAFMLELIRVALTTHNMRVSAGLPDIEYQIEVEFSAIPDFNRFQLYTWDGVGVLKWVSPQPALLPRLSFGPKPEIDQLLTQAHTDILDACGAGGTNQLEIRYVESD